MGCIGPARRRTNGKNTSHGRLRMNTEAFGCSARGKSRKDISMETSRRAVDQSLVAKIVRSYVRKNQLSPADMPALINIVYQSLLALGKPPEPEPRNPAVQVRRSVTRNYVVCLECGWQGQVLRRHIGVRHGLGRDEYRRRWGLPFDHALIAPAYSERRSGIATELGLGQYGRGKPSAGKPARPARRRRRARSDAQPPGP
jgi:predicted transcriptional regulator